MAGKIINLHTSKESNGQYSVAMASGLFGQLPRLIKLRWPDVRVFVLTDSNVKRLYGRKLLSDLLMNAVDAWMVDFPAGEKSKNADLVNMLHTQLLEHDVRRDSLIMALGGGVVGDVAGYVAATVLRGVRYIHVPTTLLAQVDSSVGGKVGIDHPLGKNLIGAFHQPAAVYIDPLALRTLSEREYRAGLAEVVKIAAALDASFFLFLERRTSLVLKRDVRAITEMITRSVRLKAAVVQKDEFEGGLRKVLNLGHTVGHALEAACGYRLRHGECVAIGLVAESRIARDMGLLSTKDLARLLHLMHGLGLPMSFPRLKNQRKFLAALSADKKADGAVAKWVLLKGIGCAVIGVEVPTPFIEAILKRRP